MLSCDGYGSEFAENTLAGTAAASGASRPSVPDRVFSRVVQKRKCIDQSELPNRWRVSGATTEGSLPVFRSCQSYTMTNSVPLYTDGQPRLAKEKTCSAWT